MDLSNTSSRQQELLKVAEQAEEWLIALEEGESEQYPALTDWLAESPLHVELFLRATAVRRLAGSLTAQQRQQVSATSRPEDRMNVVPMQVEASGSREHVKPPASSIAWLHRRRAASISMAAALIAACGVWWWLESSELHHRYSTAIGEQRSVQMPDGSVVYLNAHSRVQVRYSPQEREIRLVEGEALFKVQPDSSRPFRVLVDGAVVQALGTQFNVYRQSKQTTVAVIEGSVQVSTRAASVPAPLTAGQAVSVAANGSIEKRQSVDVVQVMAWRQRQLVFERAPLETIVQEFNRYNAVPQIHIQDSGLRERRYTAVFDADAPGELLKFLAQDAGVDVSRQGEDAVVIRAR